MNNKKEISLLQKGRQLLNCKQFKLISTLITGMALSLLLCNQAVANPILTFEYVGSGQIVSPTGLVVVQGLIANIGDSTFTITPAFGSFLLPMPDVYNQYSWAMGAFPKFGPTVTNPPTNLAAGESITWTITTLQTWPNVPGGHRGDPVPAGTYFLDPGTISIYFSLFDPATSQLVKIPVQPATSNFEWTVTSNASVPEPESGVLLGIGLAVLLLVFGNRTRRLVR